jgi:hydrogenase/urease accessory protein HupE
MQYSYSWAFSFIRLVTSVVGLGALIIFPVDPVTVVVVVLKKQCSLPHRRVHGIKRTYLTPRIHDLFIT